MKKRIREGAVLRDRKTGHCYVVNAVERESVAATRTVCISDLDEWDIVSNPAPPQVPHEAWR